MSQSDREIVLSAARHIEDCEPRISSAINELGRDKRAMQFQGIIDTLELHAAKLRGLTSGQPEPSELVDAFPTPENAATALRRAGAYIRHADDTPIIEENITTVDAAVATLRAHIQDS